MARHIKLKTQPENPVEETKSTEQTTENTLMEPPKKRGRKKNVAEELPLQEQLPEQTAPDISNQPTAEVNENVSAPPTPQERPTYERKERHHQNNKNNNYKNNHQNNYNNKKHRPRNTSDQQIKESEINLDDYPILENLDYQKYSRYLFAAYEHSTDPKKVISQVFCDDHNMLFINQLKQLSIKELFMVAAHLHLENYESMHTQELIYAILGKHADDKGVIYGGGTLQLVEGGYGFLRSARYSYLPSSDDIYVAPSQISSLRLRTGDLVQGQIRRPQPNESQKFFAILKVESINDKDAAEARRRTLFSNLTPLFPDQRITLERSTSGLGMRIMDIFAPIGKGQRALIVSPPKAGKTTILKDIANSITSNHPEIKLIIFLVDERPEEVTDMQRSVQAEVVYSTFDEPADKHVKVAQMVLEKSRSLVESGYDVVILLDSITRLARAYNQVEPSTGKVLSGGIDSGALHKPKKFFGAARNIEEGGSLTIIATALVDTGSKMDDIIFEEFKGTGNMEINLDRNLANQRLYPAFDIKISGTRREDLLLTPATLEQTRMLRKVFSNMSNEEIIYKISQAMKKFPSNEEFLSNLAFLQTLK
ncbi:MAG: transcription termination factor Rho [Brevinema sp.]